jgi:ribosomal protein S18 acetylase RimI-like enzyme
MDIAIRPATPGDAALLAEVINLAGEGLPKVVWQGMAGPGGDAWAVGRARAERDTGGFSWRNARIAEIGGRPAGGLVGYLTAAGAEPLGPDTPAMFRPVIELENMVPETRYVNALAVLPEARRQGVARVLMDEALAAPGPNGVSLIVSDGNARALGFYRSLGFAEQARRPIVPGDWITRSREWVLMVRR